MSIRVWTVSEEKAGTLTQCIGVAQHIDPRPNKIIIRRPLPKWRKGVINPYRTRVADAPDVIISCGGLAGSHVRAIADACELRPLTVHLAAPGSQFETVFDHAFISRHDWDAQNADHSNLHPMFGVPHQISAEMITGMRSKSRRNWAHNADRVVTVLAGGPNRAYVYDDATVDRLVETVQSLASAGWTALVSTSRRSRPDLLPRLLAIQNERIIVWDRTGENPYREFLAAADAFLVTKDSITMCCEAVTVGKPTFVFNLAKGDGERRLKKFEWFHRDMSEELKLTRPFDGEIYDYQYEPLAEAERIAATITQAIATTRPDLASAATHPSRVERIESARMEALDRQLDRKTPFKGFDQSLRHHRDWLDAHALLHRPWLILGSAPEPTIPPRLPDNIVHAHVRFAGRSARLNGLPPGDLTLLPRWKDAQRNSGLEFKSILRLRRTLTKRGWLNRLLKRNRLSESELTTPERDDYIIKALGSLFAKTERRPSNGVGLLCFALAHGIPSVIIAGISFDALGHEYEISKSPRRHLEEDRAALQRVAELFPFVSTTEQSLHEATGIPLYVF